MHEFKHQKLTQQIIGCAITVHNTLGNGFQEKIYQRALKIEMENMALNFQREISIPIFYQALNIGTRRVDFVVDDKIIVEIKARSQLEKVHFTQAKNYLEAFKFEIGLIINFGSPSLQFHRLTNKKITTN